MTTEAQKKKKRKRALKILACLVGVFVLIGCCSAGGLMFLGSDESASAPTVIPATPVVAAPATIPGVVTTEANASNATAAAATSVPLPTRVPIATDTPVPVPAKLGTSRSNPVPRGYDLVLEGTEALRITEVLRPADQLVADGNMFNSPPEPGNEYIWVTLQVQCLVPSDSDHQCRIDSWDYKLVGSSGVVRDNEMWTAGIPGELKDQEFYGGATVTGGLLFQIAQGETDLVLIYEPWLSFFADRVYLAVEP